MKEFELPGAWYALPEIQVFLGRGGIWEVRKSWGVRDFSKIASLVKANVMPSLDRRFEWLVVVRAISSGWARCQLVLGKLTATMRNVMLGIIALSHPLEVKPAIVGRQCSEFFRGLHFQQLKRTEM
jgi:hypothetical protein